MDRVSFTEGRTSAIEAREVFPADSASIPDRDRRAESDSSPSMERSSGSARDSFRTGITYSGSPSSAIMATVG